MIIIERTFSEKGNPFYGKKHSELTKNKLRKLRNKEVIINDIIYDSCLDASLQLNLSIYQIRYRVKSNNYSNYKYKEVAYA